MLIRETDEASPECHRARPVLTTPQRSEARQRGEETHMWKVKSKGNEIGNKVTSCKSERPKTPDHAFVDVH